MAIHALNNHFDYFFGRLNPSPTFEQQAASQYSSVKGLIENPRGLASELAPQCFLQGSYRQETAIYTINDVDIVVLCSLWFAGSGTGKSWDRNAIFGTIAAPLLNDRTYRDKVRFGPSSMCIKVELDIKLEILPVVYQAGHHDPSYEPFVLWRPERARWGNGYARYHQARLTAKNATALTQGNFKPTVKVFKHLRSRFGLDAVSFHIECLLYSLPNKLYLGGPADYIPALLAHVADTSANDWYANVINTPCGDRDIFDGTEWDWVRWQAFHKRLIHWARRARLASQAVNRDQALEEWQVLLGADFFPKEVS